MAKLNQEQAQEIINRYIDGESSYNLINQYGLRKSAIRSLIKGETWKKCYRPENIEDILHNKRGPQCKNCLI